MELKLVPIQKTEDMNIIIGMSHFIKTVEDIHELVVSSVPEAQFGLAFCEASGPRKIRTTGTNQELIQVAAKAAQAVGAGHSFYLAMRDMYPINILPKLKAVPEVVSIFCATANPLSVVVCESEEGKGILGVIDGGSATGVETGKEKRQRIKFLRDIGYKLK